MFANFARNVLRRQMSTKVNRERLSIPAYASEEVGAANPTWLKHGLKDKIFVGIAAGGLALGLLMEGGILVRMITGKKL